ncbi:glycosyltransferase [Enorma phocaeensis]|uniref:Glycosyltransferase n=2 Tax=Enorma phocaeensis TaxID=1871019 RepID=A0ABT7V713_9ACTN|nr:glycosyltransferase [Enorma phocaeensis]MDM8274174.1 glycosyltransferase [Enorma phocaeensis]
MRSLHKSLAACGVDSYIFWGRRHETISGHEQCFATRCGYLLHGAMARLDDRAGFHSKYDTARLLRLLDEIDPDVVHLHNVHGYYINIEMLFGWLASHRCQVRWTLHDCWAFTGHCPHFQYVGCNKWTKGCSRCPQRHGYPSSYLLDSSRRNWEDKRRVFTSVPAGRMTLITPSHWLEGLVRQSFLKKYPIEVRHNTVDRSIFKPTPSDFRERYDIGDRFMILGVSSPWTERKGLGDFVQLSEKLEIENYAIVLVGLSKGQLKSLPKDMIGLKHTDSAQELAGIYSTADVFFNPTVEDNYPTVNLEAEACGTPVITYDTGGCAETVGAVRSSTVLCAGADVATHIEAMREQCIVRL